MIERCGGPSPLEYPDYRAFLRARFAGMRERRPNTSQGAFARLVGLSPSRVSEILAGKQGLSATRALQLAQRLELNTHDRTVFCDLVAVEHARSRVEKNAAAMRLAERRQTVSHAQMPPGKFASIADWYHFAILAYLHQGGADEKELAASLQLPEDLVRNALRNLKRERLIRLEKRLWRVTGEPLEVKSDVASASIRRFHSQMLSRAQRALDTTAPDAREFVTVLLRMSSEQLPEVRLRIRKFWTALERDLEKVDARSKIYALAVQYFPLGS